MGSAAFDIELIRTGALGSAERRAAERAARRGTLERVRPGVLVRAGSINGLRPADRHVLLIRASVPRIPVGAVVGWLSASSLLGLPHVGPWPPKVHLLDATTTHTTVTAWFVRHGVSQHPFSEPGLVNGIPVAPLPRTIVDVAATQPALRSVPAIDHALRHGLASVDDLSRELAAVEPKGHTRAQAALTMGSALSGSPAESIGRVRFRQLGAPDPVQQHEFARVGERRASVDFWFPDQGVVVEVDGRAKYEDPAMLGGRSTADAHWQEKRREDFLRSFPEVRFVVRFSWSDLMDLEVVRAALVRAGIPCR
jgi:hypothetical protein